MVRTGEIAQLVINNHRPCTPGGPSRKWGALMSENMAIALVGIGVGILQGLILLVLSGIKSDIKDLWTRVYDHYHEVHCDNAECNSLKTGNVIVPGASH
jgi:hypothetical protein